MTQSINYYFQLEDELSTTIDSMDKQDLIALAYRLLSIHQNAYGFVHKVILSGLPDSQGFKLNRELKLADEDLIQLAHGLLSKAV